MAIEAEWEDRVTQARRERQVNADAAARRLADATAAADRSIRWLAAYRRQPAWRRLLGLLAARAATGALDGARDTLGWAVPMAAAAAVGANPRRWGVFSGGAAFHLEATLDQARLRLEILTARMPTASRPALRAAGDRMVALEQSLPRARVAAWRSPDAPSPAERELAQQVATLAENLDALAHAPTLAEGAKVLRGLRRRLLDYLPAAHRPLVRSVRELDRPVPEAGEAATAACLSVTEPLTDDGPLALHDLVVHPELRGRGAGTAALQELLAFADHAHRVVVAEFMPSADDTLRGPARQPGPPADQLAAAARWYYRHGFRVGDQPPERWQFQARMRREPHGHAGGPPTPAGNR
jgi:ribosomal protein S18 acetylase RimI-like enzyme